MKLSLILVLLLTLIFVLGAAIRQLCMRATPDARLLGLSEDQVLNRLGSPSVDSRLGADRGRDRFFLGYYDFFGRRVMVRFASGRVDSVEPGPSGW
jgi:hypothetical protein